MRRAAKRIANTHRAAALGAVVTGIALIFAGPARAADPAGDSANPTTNPTIAPPAMNPADPAQPGGASSDTSAASVAQTAARDLRQQVTTLFDPAAAQPARDEAARRLVNRASEDAWQALSNALQDQNTGGQLAAARAVADAADPDPRLVTPLFATFQGTRKDVFDAAARALARYKSDPSVFANFLAIAGKPQQRDFVRAAVLRELSSFPDKRAAETLVRVGSDDNESVIVRDGAADGLVGMTGLTEYGTDMQRWSAWWTGQKGKSDSDFRNDVLTRKAGDLGLVQDRYKELTAEVARIFHEQYQQAAPEQKEVTLLSYLKSSDPDVRAIGAQLVAEDFNSGVLISDAVRKQVRSLIGDSSPQVRQQAAVVVVNLNDKDAVDLVLAQLEQESEPTVRETLAISLGPTKAVRAVKKLLQLLDDPSYAVARAAAISLKTLGSDVHKSDKPLAALTARRLKETLENRTGRDEKSRVAGTLQLREACVEALVPLAEADVVDDNGVKRYQADEVVASVVVSLQALLQPQTESSVPVRAAIVRAFGAMRDEHYANLVDQSLSDPQPRVRLEAAKAMKNFKNIDVFITHLWERMDPNKEVDESVRNMAWEAVSSTVPLATDQQLADWAERLRTQPSRRLIVLKGLADKLVAAQDADPLSTVQQQIADTLVQDPLNDYAHAVPYYRAALEFKKANVGAGVPQIVIDTLVKNVANALLMSKQYPEACAFAADALKDTPTYQSDFGALIRDRIDALIEAGSLDDAQKLLDDAAKMRPSLADQYTRDLRELQEKLKRVLVEKNRGSRTPYASPDRPGVGDSLTMNP